MAGAVEVVGAASEHAVVAGQRMVVAGGQLTGQQMVWAEGQLTGQQMVVAEDSRVPPVLAEPRWALLLRGRALLMNRAWLLRRQWSTRSALRAS